MQFLSKVTKGGIYWLKQQFYKFLKCKSRHKVFAIYKEGIKDFTTKKAMEKKQNKFMRNFKDVNLFGDNVKQE